MKLMLTVKQLLWLRTVPRLASHAKRTLFIKDGRIYHELYRGDLSLKDLPTTN